MSPTKLENLCTKTCELVLQVGQFLREELGKVSDEAIEVKGLNSLVSYVDQEAERKLVAGLSQFLPGSSFLTEEETVQASSGTYQWIIDPLDGTTNFLHQLPVFGISVALLEEGQLILGVVYEPNRDECFYAWKEGGAFLNKRKIQVRSNPLLSESLLATGFPYYDYSRMEQYLNTLRILMKSTRGLRRYGAAAIDLVYVACGRFDAFFEYSLQPWDIAGGAIIVQEAGGIVTDFKNGDTFISGAEIIAASPKIHPQLLAIIKEEFPT
ncbi:MAG: inositol monophosphatase [Saprospiraceae bacterium]